MMQRKLPLIYAVLSVWLFCSQGELHAQGFEYFKPFAPIGTVWEFRNITPNSSVPGYTYKSEIDTIINGRKVVIVVCNASDTMGVRLNWGKEYAYTETDSGKVYFRMGSAFRCVFDFTEPVGTTHVVMDTTFTGFFQFSKVNPFKRFSYQVLRKGNMTIDNKVYRTMDLGPDLNADWTFGLNKNGYERVIEGFGSTAGWTVIGGPRYVSSLGRRPVMCSVGQNPVNHPGLYSTCDSLTSIFERATIPVLSSYPNPFHNEVRIPALVGQRAELWLSDAIGRVYFCPPANADGNLNLEHLQVGVYFLHVSMADGRRGVVKMVKE
ncbi:MAG: T9SS type A sorting domain-containing protein [Bacteroidota bacterium]